MAEYKNSDMLIVINEYVHNPRYRDILRRRFCDGYTYEEIAEDVNFSPQHVKYICTTYKPILMSYL